jgi:hypothetical protein
MNNDLLNISLNQGKQFKTYQTKIKKSVLRSKRKNLKEGFVTAEQEMLVRPPDEGYKQIFQQEQASANATKSVSQKELNELTNLHNKFNNLMQQYNTIQASIGSSSLATINRISPNNPYINKIIKFPTGELYYVTSQGIAKSIASEEILNSLSTKKNPVNIEIQWLNDYLIPGQTIPTSPSLIVGSPVKINENLGNEGRNVYVSNMVNNPTSTYYGCYNDKPAPTEVLLLPIMNSSNYVNGYQSFASSIYQDNNDFAGPWCAFDNNVNTWWHSYEGAPHDYDANTGQYKGQFGVPNIINSSGQPQTIMGEYLQINLPNLNLVTVTKYDIQGRQDCCGDPNGKDPNTNARDPNTWYILGWKDNQWYQVDYQSNVSFNWQMKTFNITNPQAYGAYIILVTAVGDPNSPVGMRSSVQIATWNLYANQESSITNDQRAMNWDEGPYITFEQCQKNALDNGYQYFGLQDYRSDGTAACLMSNDITKTISYGNANIQTSITPIWASNTVNNPGAYASLTTDGNLIVYSADNKILFSSSSGDSKCSSYYSEFPDTDNPGYDIFSTSNMSPEDCKKSCDDNVNCAGYLVGNTVFQNYCWLKNASNSSNFKQYSGLNYFEKNPAQANCKFILILQDDGQVGIYKGENVSQAGESIWKTNTFGKQKSPNNAYIASLGKTGTNYMTSGNSLMSGEWIGSNDGSLQLLMQSDGNLVLYTTEQNSGCVTGKLNKSYGGPWVNAVYKIDNVGNKSSLGKVGFVDSDSVLKPYPDNMLGQSQVYQIFQGYDSPGNDLGSWSGVSQSDCETQCNSNTNCYGYAYDPSNQICWIKDSSIYPKGDKISNPNRVLGIRKPGIINPSGCPSDIVDIDSIQYDNYTKGDQMTMDTKCSTPLVSQKDQLSYDNIQSQLIILGNDIASKMENLYNQDKNIYNRLNMNESQFKKYIEKYKNVNMEIKKELELDSTNNNMEGMLNMNDVNGMLSNTDLVVLQENYNYIFWSVLAIGIVTITINIMKK